VTVIDQFLSPIVLASQNVFTVETLMNQSINKREKVVYLTF